MIDRDIETIPLIAGPLSEHDRPGVMPPVTPGQNPDAYWRESINTQAPAPTPTVTIQNVDRQQMMCDLVQEHLESQDYRGARLIARDYLNENTSAYHHAIRTALRGLISTVETPDDLAELQEDHQRFHSFLERNTTRLQKARKPERRQKLRKLLAGAELIDSDMAWPLVGATCRIEGPEAALTYMQRNPHGLFAEAACLVALYEQAQRMRQAVPAAAQIRAGEVAAALEPGIVIRTRLMSAMQPQHPQPAGRTVLKLV